MEGIPLCGDGLRPEPPHGAAGGVFHGRNEPRGTKLQHRKLEPYRLQPRHARHIWSALDDRQGIRRPRRYPPCGVHGQPAHQMGQAPPRDSHRLLPDGDRLRFSMDAAHDAGEQHFKHHMDGGDAAHLLHRLYYVSHHLLRQSLERMPR